VWRHIFLQQFEIELVGLPRGLLRELLDGDTYGQLPPSLRVEPYPHRSRHRMRSQGLGHLVFRSCRFAALPEVLAHTLWPASFCRQPDLEGLDEDQVLQETNTYLVDALRLTL
jgi:hypothetical protein